MKPSIPLVVGVTVAAAVFAVGVALFSSRNGERTSAPADAAYRWPSRRTSHSYSYLGDPYGAYSSNVAAQNLPLTMVAVGLF